jgi:hypothetical protein
MIRPAQALSEPALTRYPASGRRPALDEDGLFRRCSEFDDA